MKKIILFTLLFTISGLSLAARSKNDALYQLDYRERIRIGFEIPEITKFRVRKSFETRYRPVKTKKTEKVSSVKL